MARSRAILQKGGRAVSSFLLRLLALAFMGIDHMGLALFPAVPAFRLVGRMAFPMYCFLLAQGYRHTRDVRAYARRLLLLALISEVPFDLLIFGRVFSAAEQNALFSLLLGLAALALADRLRGRPLLLICAELLLCMIAMALRVSYGWLGIALCLCFAERRRGMAFLSAAAALLLYTLSLLCSGVELHWALLSLCALGALPILMLYNGKPGPRLPLLRFLFYAAYPLHLAVLFALRAARLVPPYWLT